MPDEGDWMQKVRRAWRWLWYDDSLLSWIVSIGLAFLVIKFVFYPVLGLTFGTQFPVVAVVSSSMEHHLPFDEWWAQQEDLYLRYNITKSEFETFPMQSGFNKGDIIILWGTPPEKIDVGQVIVFWGDQSYPIIHRVVNKAIDNEGQLYFATKGDNNLGQIIKPRLDERHIPIERPCSEEPSKQCDVVLGRAILRVPLLGWVKIGFVNLLNAVGIPVQ